MIRSCGASIAVVTLDSQRGLVCGHPESPPPVTVAVFTRDSPATLRAGVTGISKLTEAPGAKPVGIVQVTC